MDHFLTPVLALILWTLIMLAVMYVRRIPAMQKMEVDPQRFAHEPELGAKLPEKARWAADNYNHLHEQPVIFYALMFYLFLVGATGWWVGGLAWAYVGTRIIHSLVQVTSNRIMVRFVLFLLCSMILIVMSGYGLGFALGGHISS